MVSPWVGVVVDGPRAALPQVRVVVSALDGDAHRAGGPCDDLGSLLDVVRVQVLELRLRDLTDLGGGELADLLRVGLAGTLGDAGGLLDELRGRRGLRDEGEGPVLV